MGKKNARHHNRANASAQDSSNPLATQRAAAAPPHGQARLRRQPAAPSNAHCSASSANTSSRPTAPGFAAHAAAQSPCTKAAQAWVPPHSGHGQPVSAKKPQPRLSRLSTANSSGVAAATSGAAKPTPTRCNRCVLSSRCQAADASAEFDVDGVTAAIARTARIAQQLARHEVRANHRQRPRHQHADTAQQNAQAANNAQHQRAPKGGT